MSASIFLSLDSSKLAALERRVVVVLIKAQRTKRADEV